MRISGLHIDGFGIYYQQGVQNIPAGLVLFLGENESGKTTLMEFIRTVLFGFPRKDTRNVYPPLRGGNHGGRLQLLMQDGRQFTIERLGRHATIAADGGSVEKEEPAARLLRGLDRTTFEHVFAIGLKDLQGLKVLSQEGVRGRLFSASAGLGAASVPAALKTLDDQLKELLSQRGQQQLINQLVNRLDAIGKELKRLRGQAAAYAEGQRRREKLAEQIRRNRGEEETIRQRVRRLEQLEHAREPWLNLRQGQEKAKALEFAQGFPTNGLERFNNLKKDLEQLNQDLKAKEGEAARHEQELSRLTVDEALLAQQETIDALLGEREKLATALSEYPMVKTRMEQAEEEFLRRLRELGADWDAAKLDQVDTSVKVRQQVQEFARKLEATERQHEQTLANQSAKLEAVAEAKRRADVTAQQWQEIPAPPQDDAQQLQRQQDAVRLLRPLLHERDLAATRLQARLTAQQEAAARLASLQKQSETQAVLLPWWLSLVAAVAGLGLAAVWTYERSYVPAGLMLLAGLGLAALLHLLRRRQENAETTRFDQIQEEQQQVALTQKTLTEEIGNLKEQIVGLEQDLQRGAQGAGLKRPRDLTQLEQLAGEVAHAAEQLREWQTRESEKDKAESEWREACEKLQKAEQEKARSAQELQALRDQWEEWLAAWGFSGQVRPQGFEVVLQAVENARGAKVNLEEFRRRVRQMTSYLTEARTKISQVLEACGRTPLSGEAGVPDLEALRRSLTAAREIQEQQRNLAAKLAAAQAEAAQLTEQKTNKEAELHDLLQKAGAADDEEFRRVAASHQEWRDWVQKIDANEIALRHLAGTSEAQAALENELSEIESLEIKAEKERLEGQLNEVMAEFSNDDREDAVLKDKLAQMAQSEELGRLLLEQRSLQEQLGGASKRWATLVVCRHLLDQARGVYERERQPQVIKEAGRFLNTMAQERYRLVSAVGEDGIQLEDTSLRRKEEICWSAGLADQVYLAIRLGLAREFGRHSEPLPVILDDVLVKFDPVRRLEAVRVILEFSQEQQVLLFSCHPEFKEIIERVRRDPHHHGALVTYFTIADGVIIP